MAYFFINRPIFAWVVAIFITLGGLLALSQLPIAQYPSVAPPAINITATYPGASAKTLDETVVSVIENELNGAEGMIYMQSVSQVNGVAEIMVTFSAETDPSMAQVDIQNRLARATPRLPQSVNKQGIKVEQANSNVLMIVTLNSSDAGVNRFMLGDYMSRHILPELQRVPGVGQARLFGAERSMRIWLDMDKLTALNISTAEVKQAIENQNAQVSSGIMGALPSLEGQQVSATIVIQGQLSTPEAFGNILLRANNDGGRVYLKDVARIGIGGQSYAVSAKQGNGEVVGLAIQPSPSSNAVETAAEVYDRLEEMKPFFPSGMEYGVPIDASKFIKISIEKVFTTLIEAMILVFIVMFIFLQKIRYTLIPAIVVPISLLGTCLVLLTLGFSINVLTMFAMVLAIGILVDDAIVVVENVERIMAEEGLSPFKATVKGMQQITGALLGITVVLVSVFVPMGFFGGSVGNIYRQFSFTMVAAILFSMFFAFSLTPALCATLLKPVNKEDHNKKTIFSGFNTLFDKGINLYGRMVNAILNKAALFFILYIGIVGAVGWLFIHLPTSFLPEEDQGRIFTVTQLPAGATIERSVKVANTIEEFYLAQPEVANVISILGTNFFGAGQNMVNTFVSLKNWDERPNEDNSAQALVGRAMGTLVGMKDAFSVAINPPPIPELGNGVGFSVRLQDRASLGHQELLKARDQLIGMIGTEPSIGSLRVEGVEDAPQLHFKVDRERAYTLGINFNDLNDVLSTALGSSYVNDFPNQGRMQRVIVQAEARFRMQAEDILQLQVKNNQGSMIPLSAIMSVEWQQGAMQLVRYNGYSAYRLAGTAAPGFSTGDTMQAVERLMAKLPQGIGYEWTGVSREERISGSQMPFLLALSVLAVFLCLAALYESWAVPFAVILVVPLGIFGSLVAASLLGMANDVYFKVGLITIIGLASKNAILIIEFARHMQQQGEDLTQSILHASKQRLRPILMTSMAFILGVVPLAIASGAGAAGQRAIGIGVMGGMISATVLAIFLVPVFYFLVVKLSGKKA